MFGRGGPAAGAIMLSGFTFAENSDEESPLGCSGNITAPSVSLNEEAEPELSYRYLRGTMYKNLYEAGYRNLFETTLPEEIIPEELPAEGGNYQTSVGGAANPGYSGSVGSYSLNDKTIAAHLTVQGTSIQDRAIWQCSTSTSYYEPKERCVGGQNRKSPQRRAFPEHRYLRPQLEQLLCSLQKNRQPVRIPHGVHL